MHDKFDSDNWKYFLSFNKNNLNKFIFGAFFKFNKKSNESFFYCEFRCTCQLLWIQGISIQGVETSIILLKNLGMKEVCVSEWVMFMIFIFVCFLLIFQSQFSVAIFCSVRAEMRGKGFYTVSPYHVLC